MIVNSNALYTALEKRGIRMIDVARALGVNRSQVTMWNQLRVPPNRLRALREHFGIEGHELRPDIFDPPKEAGKAA